MFAFILAGAFFVRVCRVGVLQTIEGMLKTCPQLFVARREGLLRAFAAIFEVSAGDAAGKFCMSIFSFMMRAYELV